MLDDLERDAFLCTVYRHDLDAQLVSDLADVVRVDPLRVGIRICPHLANVNETGDADADVDKGAKSDDVLHGPEHAISDLQLLDGVVVCPLERRRCALAADVAAWREHVLDDVFERGHADVDGLREMLQVEILTRFLHLSQHGLQMRQIFAGDVLFHHPVWDKDFQQAVNDVVGLWMDAGVVQSIVAVYDTQKAGALLKCLDLNVMHVQHLLPVNKVPMQDPMLDDGLCQVG